MLVYATNVAANLLIGGIRGTTSREKLSVRICSTPTVVTRRTVRDRTVSTLVVNPRSGCRVTQLGSFLACGTMPCGLVSERGCRVLSKRTILRRVVTLVKRWRGRWSGATDTGYG